MSRNKRAGVLCAGLFVLGLAGCAGGNTSVPRSSPAAGSEALVSAEQLPLNYFQFLGSHNSYKTAIPPATLAQLRAVNPQAALALDYWHAPIAAQLDAGLRVLEFDVFYDPQQRLFGRAGDFPVVHVQNIDTGSHCINLGECLASVVDWSLANPDHEPLMISFNAKTDVIDQPGFIRPNEFDMTAWQEFDGVLRESLGARIINPAEVLAPDGPKWPALSEARGRVLLLLDEGPAKHATYLAAVAKPALFANVPADDPRAAIRVINDPLSGAKEIALALQRGLLVRTRADADTAEARTGSTTRRDAAFASGAQFVSTDYYIAASHFGTDYQVTLPGGGAIRCNPKVTHKVCKD